MKMKGLMLCLLFPVASFAQTIHFNDEEIRYKGDVAVVGLTEKEIISGFEPALRHLVEDNRVALEWSPARNTFTTAGVLTLNSPFSMVRKLHFTLQLMAEKGAYSYRIDSVFLTENRRGFKPEKISDKKLLEGMEDTGAAAAATERTLNEIDLRIQKLLAMLQLAMKKKNK